MDFSFHFCPLLCQIWSPALRACQASSQTLSYIPTPRRVKFKPHLSACPLPASSLQQSPPFLMAFLKEKGNDIPHILEQQGGKKETLG